MPPTRTRGTHVQAERRARTPDGQSAVVTGASKGIGAAIAIRLAAEGAAVAVNHSSDHPDSKQAADRVVAAIRSSGGVAHAVPADVGTASRIATPAAAGHAGAASRKSPCPPPPSGGHGVCRRTSPSPEGGVRRPAPGAGLWPRRPGVPESRGHQHMTAVSPAPHEEYRRTRTT
ncbi:hypothetical protein DMH12_11290 [Streptomyces sp. WAC 04229]|uniref:SDR family NAD(P)-dependent oxidoreductase n=1 Tax=Streptomyces sp. WAC 04229 TaxID=2203206 RepID=UPI000F740D30|nr:SDR family NAD(P)-dependent oxidoreductase [Streptomyces sp. WAC 04229]RSN58131.1 hypothetical protein DMH12_11290 [Streptomyces sp. WAC 04229]